MSALWNDDGTVKRPSWSRHMMNQAHGAAAMSPCVKRKVGALIVRDKDPLVSGFNGPPDNAPHRTVVPGPHQCVRIGIETGTQADVVCCAHAEQNAISTAARRGIATAGCTLFTTVAPCAWCARAIIRAGIIKVVREGDYGDRFAADVLAASGIIVEVLDPSTP